MGVVDVAFFGSLASVETPKGKPGCIVLNPSDAVSTYKLAVLMANHEGMVYLRTLRPETPFLYKPEEKFDLVGQKSLAQGKDLTIVAWGYMVHEALRAAKTLQGEGIACGVVDAYSLPLADGFLNAIGAGDGSTLLVVEDNYAGGLGAAVAAAAGAVRGLCTVTMTAERMPKSAKTADDVLRHIGLDCDAICRKARAILNV